MLAPHPSIRRQGPDPCRTLNLGTDGTKRSRGCISASSESHMGLHPSGGRSGDGLVNVIRKHDHRTHGRGELRICPIDVGACTDLLSKIGNDVNHAYISADSMTPCLGNRLCWRIQTPILVTHLCAPLTSIHDGHTASHLRAEPPRPQRGYLQHLSGEPAQAALDNRCKLSQTGEAQTGQCDISRLKDTDNEEI